MAILWNAFEAKRKEPMDVELTREEIDLCMTALRLMVSDAMFQKLSERDERLLRMAEELLTKFQEMKDRK